MKKSSAIKKAQMGAAIPGSKNGKSAPPKFKKSSPIPAGVPMPKGPSKPMPTRPKAKNGSKVAIKKAQKGTTMVVDGKEYKEGSMLPEAVVTGKPIKSLKDRVKSVKDKVESIGDGLGLNRSYKPKPAKRSILTVKTYRQRGFGPGSGLTKLKQRISRRYEEGGQVSKAQNGASKKKYDYFWQDPESTYSKRNEEARQNSKMRFLTDQILPQDKVQKFGKFEGYKYYDNANSESPKLLNDAARLAKKPNVTKAATPSLSKKDIKTYKKTGAAPKAKQGAVVKKKAVVRKPKK